MPSDLSANIVVTLVHGTLARHNKFPELESALRSLAGTDVTRVGWSGWNTATARRLGTEKVKAHIRDVAARNPTARQFVIGHSHGGSIAVQSLHDDDIRSHLSGVVCLSTPFISVTARRIDDLDRKLGWFVATVSCFATAALFHYGTKLPDVPGGRFFMTLTLVGLVVALMLVGGRRALSAFVERARWPADIRTPLLIVRSSSDEASAALAAVQFATWVLDQLWQFLNGAWVRLAISAMESVLGERIARRMPRVYVWTVVMAIATLALAWTMLLVPGFAGSAFQSVLAGVAAALILVSALPLLVAVWMTTVGMLALVPALLIGFVALLPLFGPEYAMRAAYLKVSVESTPPGIWTVHSFIAADDTALSHSSTYRDPQAIRAVVEFIKQHGGA
jgi:hypothetical protein